MTEFTKNLDLAQKYSKKGKIKKTIRFWEKVVQIKPELVRINDISLLK